MIDESHISISLFLRSMGVRNPFVDDEDNISIHSSRSSRSGRSYGSRGSAQQQQRNGQGGGGGDGHRSFRGSRIGIDIGSNGGGGEGSSNDVMVPPEDSDDRKGTIFTGSTALALTLGGPCALEAPHAFQKCGIFWGTILFGCMIYSTERVLRMLCICARKTGSNSYGTVARSSCGGYRAHFQTSALEISVLLLIVVHYVTMLRHVSELWLQSFHNLIGDSVSGNGGGEAEISSQTTWMLLVLLLMTLPFLIPMQFHTLKYAWTVGLLNVLVFAISVFILAILHFYQQEQEQQIMQSQSAGGPTTTDGNPDHTKRNMWDVIEGFQRLLIAFMASFNVLPIQAALQDPTRERMETVVRRGVIVGASLTYLVGIIGYFCIIAHKSSSSSSSSIDASFLDAIRYLQSSSDASGAVSTTAVQNFSLVVHRICHSSAVLATLIAFPLILIPCRFSILELIESIYAERQCPEISDCQEDCDTCTTRASTVTEEQQQQNRNNALVVVRHNDESIPPSESSYLLPSIEENPTYDLLSNPIAKILCTLGILFWAFLGGVLIPLMDSFYTWVGPLLVYVFAYILPSMYFLGIQRPQRGDTEKKSSRLFARILVFFCISGIICSVVYIVAHLPTTSRSG